MKKTTNTKIQDRKVIRDLRFELTDAELMAKADRAANLQRQIGEEDREFKNIKDSFAAKLRTLRAEMHTELDKVREKSEVRTVDCVERFNYDTREVTTIYGKKVMETRAMRGDEFQTFMDLEKKTNAKKTPSSKKVTGIDSFKDKKAKGKNISDEKKLLAEKSQLHAQKIDREMRNTSSALNA